MTIPVVRSFKASPAGPRISWTSSGKIGPAIELLRRTATSTTTAVTKPALRSSRSMPSPADDRDGDGSRRKFSWQKKSTRSPPISRIAAPARKAPRYPQAEATTPPPRGPTQLPNITAACIIPKAKPLRRSGTTLATRVMLAETVPVRVPCSSRRTIRSPTLRASDIPTITAAPPIIERTTIDLRP